MDALLRQVADARALRLENRPAARLEDARDALHERRFPRAVVTGEGDALARLHGKRQIVEKHAGAELDAQ